MNTEKLTDRLYERDSYIKEFAAKVLSCNQIEENRYSVILDVTAFSPEAGGQDADKGTLGNANIIDVQIENEQIIHYVDKPLEIDSQVIGTIDWEYRFRKMQNHSGEHLFCSIIHNAYGFDNVGFHMNAEEVTLDMDGQLSPEELLVIEKRANEAIYENVPITVSFPTPEECAQLEYRSKLDLKENVRLVTIENYDVCACCAPHVSSTGQIGVIKIIDSFYHRGGTRITIRAGISAYEDYAQIDKSTKGLIGLLSSKRYDTYEFAVRSDERYHELLEENIRLKKLISENEANKILADMEKEIDLNKAKVIFSEILDRVQMRNIINAIAEKYPIIIGGFLGNDSIGYDYIIGRGIGNETNLSIFAKELNSKFDGRGGGKPEMIQGHISGTKIEINNFFKI